MSVSQLSIQGKFEIRKALDDKTLTDSQKLNIVLNSFDKLEEQYRWEVAYKRDYEEKNKKLRQQLKLLKR